MSTVATYPSQPQQQTEGREWLADAQQLRLPVALIRLLSGLVRDLFQGHEESCSAAKGVCRAGGRDSGRFSSSYAAGTYRQSVFGSRRNMRTVKCCHGDHPTHTASNVLAD